MSAVRVSSLAGAIALVSTAVFAADLPLRLPEAPIETGWYLRGYLGMSNEFFKGLSHPDFAVAPEFTFLDKGGFDSAPIFGIGLGYTWNNWLRTDVTGEYRGKAGFHALDLFFNIAGNGGIGAYNTNEYTGSKSEWIGLFNAYVDLGTWWCITPYIGAGIGFANIRIDHFRDVNVIAGGGGWGDTGTRTNLAWALHAGASYRVTPHFAVELAYRYLNAGNGQTGILVNLDPTVPPVNVAPMTFHNIQSHDVMLGLRWLLLDHATYAPPLVTKG